MRRSKACLGLRPIRVPCNERPGNLPRLVPPIALFRKLSAHGCPHTRAGTCGRCLCTSVRRGARTRARNCAQTRGGSAGAKSTVQLLRCSQGDLVSRINALEHAAPAATVSPRSLAWAAHATTTTETRMWSYYSLMRAHPYAVPVDTPDTRISKRFYFVTVAVKSGARKPALRHYTCDARVVPTAVQATNLHVFARPRSAGQAPRGAGRVADTEARRRNKGRRLATAAAAAAAAAAASATAASRPWKMPRLAPDGRLQVKRTAGVGARPSLRKRDLEVTTAPPPPFCCLSGFVLASALGPPS